MKSFLKQKKDRIVDGNGNSVVLKGVNLGGWLMMEAYILYAPNFPEQQFKKQFVKALGKKSLEEFEQGFRSNFIREQDFKAIKEMGFNCIRLPFHYSLVEKAPYCYDSKGLIFMDRALRWAKKYGLWVILDLHAAPGCQNHDWHSDSLGKAQLWTNKTYQNQTCALWEFLADRYKNNETVVGYDLLNEAVLEDALLLNQFYKRVMKRIRSVDQNHILFIEGNKWATDLRCLQEYDDDNYVLSIHNYEPIDFTFNFVPFLSYPANNRDKHLIERHLRQYKRESEKRGVPIFVGEFGVNNRQGLYGEDQWLEDVLECFGNFGFHWTYWTYKAIKNGVFPDGLYSYVDNPRWVNRVGPVTGWDMYKECWKAQKQAMKRSWQTNQFQINESILKVLKNAL